MNNYQIKCEICKKYVSRIDMKEHRATHIADRLKSEECKNKIVLQINNPKGNNRWTDKKELVKNQAKPLTDQETFILLSKPEQYDKIKQLAQEVYNYDKTIRPKKLDLAWMNKIYWGLKE